MTAHRRPPYPRAGLGSAVVVSTAALAVLKLVKVITWPWLLVLSPVWIGLAVIVVIFALIILTALIDAVRGTGPRRSR